VFGIYKFLHLFAYPIPYFLCEFTFVYYYLEEDVAFWKLYVKKTKFIAYF